MNETTATTPTNDTVMDRYIRTFERASHEPEALKELESIFAPDATVQLVEGMEPVTGLPAIMEMYGHIAEGVADSKYVWTVTELDDGRLEVPWVQAARTADGRLIGQSGIEHATVNADGRITHLTNRSVPVAGWV
ncbi:nuclear transport factor 2 family protein [Streptomyces yerevanensis]|uniref:nuclear transport factor 2 family protein n=1 Tax=Streptomyces yerevanensis TaxID=66378 RepID=UPI000525FBB5|nr:nuclear transport factor 2 family protein [Streptomyces yerevanensis]